MSTPSGRHRVLRNSQCAPFPWRSRKTKLCRQLNFQSRILPVGEVLYSMRSASVLRQRGVERFVATFDWIPGRSTILRLPSAMPLCPSSARENDNAVRRGLTQPATSSWRVLRLGASQFALPILDFIPALKQGLLFRTAMMRSTGRFSSNVVAQQIVTRDDDLNDPQPGANRLFAYSKELA